MTIYDGTAFGAIDATAYVDGKPSDQWLRKKIENNVAFLYVDSPPVTVYRWGGGGGENPNVGYRAIASLKRSIFLAVPVYVDETVTEITIRINVITPVGAVQIGGTVQDLAGQIIGTLPAASLNTHISVLPEEIDFNGSYYDYTIPVRPRSSGYVLAYLTMQSRTSIAADKYAASSATFSQVRSPVLIGINLSAFSYDYDPYDTPDPYVTNPIALDAATLYNAEIDSSADVLAFATAGGSIYIFLVDEAIGVGLGGSMTDMGPQRISYMQMRSYQVSVKRRYDLREQDLIFGVTERGIDNLRHANLVRQLRSRPRMIAAGPSGNRGPWIDPLIQGVQPSIWEHAIGYDVGGAPVISPFIQTGALEPLSDGEVEIVMLIRGANHTATGEGTQDWRFVFTVDNHLDTETITQTFAIKTTGTGHAWARTANFRNTGWVSHLQRAISAFDLGLASYFPCREGQMLPPGQGSTGDLGQMSLVKMRVPMPSTGASIGLDISVTAEPTGPTEDLAIGQSATKYAHISCVAWAVYLYPEEAA
jgi:hypothetical protein